MPCIVIRMPNYPSTSDSQAFGPFASAPWANRFIGERMRSDRSDMEYIVLDLEPTVEDRSSFSFYPSEEGRRVSYGAEVGVVGCSDSRWIVPGTYSDR